jgi:DNA repair protein RecO (recombination protein O)
MANNRLYTTDAAILTQIPIGEADRILTLFTAAEGKIRAVARGVRRPKSRIAGHLEPLTFCRLMIARGRTMDIISDADTIANYPRLRGSLEGIAYGSVCVELVNAFTPDEEADIPLLNLLTDCFSWINDGERSLALYYFEYALLCHVGFMPELYNCVACSKPIEPDNHGFSHRFGGTICNTCSHIEFRPPPTAQNHGPTFPLSLNTLKILRFFQSNKFKEVRNLKMNNPLTLEISRLLQDYITYLLERRLKSTAFLQALPKL